jgi:hypothetical protein
MKFRRYRHSFSRKSDFLFLGKFFSVFGLVQTGNTSVLSEFAVFLSDFRAFARTVP